MESVRVSIVTTTISYPVDALPAFRPQRFDGRWTFARLDDAVEVVIPFAHKLIASVELHAPLDTDHVEVCRLSVGNTLVVGDQVIGSDRPVGYLAYSSLPPEEAAAVAIEHLRLLQTEGSLDEQLDDIAQRVLERYDRKGLATETRRGRPPRADHKHARIAALWRQAQQLGVSSVDDYIADRVNDQDGQRPSGNTVRQWIYQARKRGFIPPKGSDVGRVASPHTATNCDHHEHATTG